MRFRNLKGRKHSMSVDGTDMQIYEPTPFSTGWYDQKFNASGVKYEVGVSLYHSSICWVKGPFPSGRFPDDKIFEMFLAKKLRRGERVVADLGYRYCPQCTTTDKFQNNEKMLDIMSRVASRQESVNKRLKQFGVLRKTFKHNKKLHKPCFMAVAVITQLNIMSDEPLFKATVY